MGTSIFEKMSGFLRGKGKYAVVLTGMLAVTAVGCRMALPGFTLERELVCGLEEHVHTEECYPEPETGTDGETKGEEGVDSTTEKVLACPFEGKEAHAHTEGCYETEKKLICGQEEEAGGHAHGDDCYSTTRELTCGQEELAGHTHDASCYQTETNLTCGQEETAGHSHGDGCYDENGNVICGQEEGAGGHAHSDACYSSEDKLVCGQEESAGHTHGDGCYTESRELTCGQEEVTGHTHTEDCYEEESKIICGKEEYNPADHVHGDECYIEKPVSGENRVPDGNIPEGNGPDAENGTLTEGSEDIERQPICGLEEHTHTDACYGAETMAIADNVIAHEDWWQLDNEGLLTITATDTVTEIPSYSYSTLSQRPWNNYLSQIKSIKIEGMQKIGDYAFRDCMQLLEVEMSEGVKAIGSNAFYNCFEATSISIPEGVTEIGSNAFVSCRKLTSINIPKSVTKIQDYAFYNCYGATSISIPEGVTEIGSNAFASCSKLTSINIPKSVTKIQDHAFYNCYGATSISISEGVTEIGSYAFASCRKLTSINIPKSITTIPNNTFFDCSGLTSINIPEGVTVIQGGAFYGCTNLRSIKLPESLTEIGNQAFRGCTSLVEVKMPENMVQIGREAFLGCTSLSSIKLPAGLTQIEGYTFSGCSGLADISLPESLTVIEGYAFEGCSALSSIKLPEGITSIGGSAFAKCGELAEFEFGPNLNTIGDQALASCNSLEHLIIKSKSLNFASDIGVSTTGLRKVTIHCDSVGELNETVLKLWQAAEVSFEGEGYFSLSSILPLGRPVRRELQSGNYYADGTGALYLLKDGTASLAYVPSGLTRYTVRNRIGGQGEWIVCSVERDALKMADDLQALDFEGAEEITELPDYCCGNCISLISVNGKNTVKEVGESFTNPDVTISPLAFYNTGLEGEAPDVADGNIEIIIDRQKMLTMSTRKREGDAGLELYTGEQAETTLNLSGQLNETDYTVARCYFSFDNKEGVTRYGKNSGDDYDFEIIDEQGNSYTVKARKASVPNVYYYEIPRPKEGGTLSLMLPSWYESPTSAGGKVKIWPVLLTEAERETLGNGVTGDGKKYHQVSWRTEKNTFPVTKTWYTASKVIPSIMGGTEEGKLYLKSLAYGIEMKNENNAPADKGKDYMLSADYTDTLVLPDGMQWREEVLEAIEAGNYFWQGRNLYVVIENDSLLLCKIDGSTEMVNFKGKKPEVVREEDKSFVRIKWSLKNSRTDGEMPAYKGWVLYFGDEVIYVDIPQDVDSFEDGYNVVNEIETVQHFTHSKDMTQTSQAEAMVQPSEGSCEIDKSSDSKLDGNKDRTWGDGYKYFITLMNKGSFPYKELDSVSDQLSSYLYIRPADMESMFREAENIDGVKKLEVRIDNAVLCKTEAADGGYCPGREVVGTDGKHYILTQQDTGAGTEYNAGEIGWDPAEKARDTQIYVVWERGGGITLTGPDGTKKVGEEADIGKGLEDIGYVVTSKAQYTVTWELENFILYSGKDVTFTIPVMIKDSFMLMEQDRLEKRSEESFQLQENRATAKAGTKEYTDKVTHRESGNEKPRRDYILQKGLKKNNQEVGSDKDSAFAGDVLNYMLRVEHRENPHRGIVPLVDRMRGAQALLIPVEDNGHLSGDGLEEINANGKGYYLLSKEGRYTNIILGGRLTDSITVTKQENGELDTMIRWYLTDIQGTGTENIDYEAYVLPALGDGSGFFSLSNESWLNDHQSHRLYDKVGILGTNVIVEKKIVASQGESKKPGEDKLEEYSPILEGTATTYRLKIENIGLEREIKGSDIYDILPLNKGFEWSKENVKVSYYDAGDGAYTLKGGDDWQIVKDGDDRCRIVWGEEFSLTLKNTIYIYVTLKWPKGNAWEDYVRACSMERLENTFWCYSLWDKVSHDLAAGTEGYLQKGVVKSEIGTRLTDDNSEKRFYYTNGGLWSEEGSGVLYYVVIYNSGYTKLYLNELQDKLPRGFSIKANGSNVPLQYSNRKISITDEEGNKVTPKWMQGRQEIRELDNGKIGIELTNGGNEKEGYLRYDPVNRKYYLAPGEAVYIQYWCYPGEYADTDDIATNSVVMPYDDITGGGFKKANLVVEGPDEENGEVLKNDGSCYLMTTEEAEKQGFIGGKADTLWLTSDVDVKRREIIPGITKKLAGVTASDGSTSNLGYANAGDIVNWTITMTNNGGEPITDYTVTDAMETPYGYIGTVTYTIEPRSNTERRVLFTISECQKKNGRMCLTLNKVTGINSEYWEWKKNGVVTKLDELELQGEDVISIRYIEKKAGTKRSTWEYDVSLSGDEGKEELNIRCKSRDMSIPPQGKSVLTLSTRNVTPTHQNKSYSNRCYITPEQQPYDSGLVTQGNNTEHHGKPSVISIARIQVSIGYTTNSQKRVEEVDKPENNTTSEDEKNYILLPGAGSLFRYTLIVDNTKTNKVAMEKLVLIDSLPQPGDHNPFTEEEPRFSGLRVDLAKTPQFEVWIKKEGEEAVMLNESQYRLEYSSKTEFTEGDWNGEGTNGWERDMESIDRTSIRSFRVVILDNGVEGSGDLIPAGASVEVKFTGEISSGENGEPPMPGETAWNGFGYRYALKGVGDDLESTPLNVGVRLPDVPRLIKELEDADGNPTSASADMPFRFLIYQGEKLNLKKGFTDKELADALLAAGREFTCVETVVKSGNSQSEMLVLKDLKKWEYFGSEGTGEETPGENGMAAGEWRPTEESWSWKDKEKYTIVELPLGEEGIYQFASLGGIKNNSYTFTHSVEQGKKIIAVNSCEGSAAYELPETGGVGSHRYTLAGYLCLVMSCLCLAAGWHLHKKKQADR